MENLPVPGPRKRTPGGRSLVALDLMIDTMHSPPAEGAFKS